MKLILSMNGSDGAGKTTQTKLLCKQNPDLIECISGLENYYPFNSITSNDWWFEESSPDEFCDIIYHSLSERNKDIIRSSKPLVIIDKGIKTFDARVIATLITKGLDELSAVKLMEKYKKKWNVEDFSQYDLYLSLGDDFNKTQEIMDSRGKNDHYSLEKQFMYRKYQLTQNKLLLNLIKTDKFIIVNALDDIKTINEQINNIILSILKNNVEHITNCTQILGIGGLSESGKSSVGKIMLNNNIPNFKFKYIVRNIDEKYSINGDLFQNNLSFVAVLMIDEIAKLMNSMYYWNMISFESLHSYELSKLMKEILPNNYKIIFLQTSEQNRISRNASELNIDYNDSKNKVVEKDNNKKNAGADRVKYIADYIIENDGTIESLSKKVYNIINDIEERVKKMRNRAGGLLISNGKLLLMHRVKEIDGQINEYYVVPGGGVEEGESLSETTIREMKEEIGINVEVLSPDPIYKFEMENGTQYFMLVKQTAGQIGTGKGPEFTDPSYANRGKYSAELIDIDDIIAGKINMVPEDVKKSFVNDIRGLKDVREISSTDLLKKEKVKIKER